jgi:hypothetical protein
MFLNKIESCLELKNNLHVVVSHQFYLVDSNFPVDENKGVIEGFL